MKLFVRKLREKTGGEKGMKICKEKEYTVLVGCKDVQRYFDSLMNEKAILYILYIFRDR